MKTQIKDFDSKEWYKEVSSGYDGYRNYKTEEWIYAEEYFYILRQQAKYEKDMELLKDFRLECLPFGEYADYVLIEFLNKRYEL